MAHDSIKTTESTRSFTETVDALEAVLKDKGLIIIAKVDHAAAAEKADLTLSPTTLFIFGNPKAGTPIMQANPLAGLDLPMKMLVTEQDGKVLVTYRSPEALVDSWNLSPVPAPIPNMIGALSAIANAAAGR